MYEKQEQMIIQTRDAVFNGTYSAKSRGMSHAVQEKKCGAGCLVPLLSFHSPKLWIFILIYEKQEQMITQTWVAVFNGT